MSLQSIHLRKLLKIMYASDPFRTRYIRDDIREEIARENGAASEGGGDFYGPFWRDAKDHVSGYSDLHETTAARISANFRRSNLYPRLRDGFLLWWNERRRWTNAPFEPISPPKIYFPVPGTDTVVKVGGVLAVRDARGDDHFVYPYWFDNPSLSDEAGRVGFWALSRALTATNADELRLLDIIRGVTFSMDRVPLHGDEAEIFRQRYASAVTDWNRLRREYD